MRSAAPAARSKSWASPVPCSGSMPKNPTPPARRTSGQAKLLVRKAPARNRQEEEEGSQGSEEARGEGNVARRGPRPGRPGRPRLEPVLAPGERDLHVVRHLRGNLDRDPEFRGIHGVRDRKSD